MNIGDVPPIQTTYPVFEPLTGEEDAAVTSLGPLPFQEEETVEDRDDLPDARYGVAGSGRSLGERQRRERKSGCGTCSTS